MRTVTVGLPAIGIVMMRTPLSRIVFLNFMLWIIRIREDKVSFNIALGPFYEACI